MFHLSVTAKAPKSLILLKVLCTVLLLVCSWALARMALSLLPQFWMQFFLAYLIFGSIFQVEISTAGRK